MKTVITYGTFDLIHHGHYRLLERARDLGDRLIVGVTSESYDANRGKLNVKQALVERIEAVKATGLADLVVVEEYEGQKIEDIQRYGVDKFAIGSDWAGKFDYLSRYCEVIYLDRTRDISSTKQRSLLHGLLRVGIIGTGRIADRFVRESRFVSGFNVEGVCSRTTRGASEFGNRNELALATTDMSELLSKVDAVYIATPHSLHYEQAMQALAADRHVLCEKPMTLEPDQTRQLYARAEHAGLTILEAIKTAYAPGFLRLVSLVHGGAIGSIRSLDAAFTRLAPTGLRETSRGYASGSLTEMGSYVLLPAAKLLGTHHKSMDIFSVLEEEGSYDTFSRITVQYDNAVATGTVGLGTKTDGRLTIAGTSGYIVVPAPWWKTSYFEIRREDPDDLQRVSLPFEGDGLRYEIAEFLKCINSGTSTSFKLSADESAFVQTGIALSPTLAIGGAR